MTTNINFPNLGIYLENVGKSVSIFGFDIAYYGIIIGIGIMAGIWLAIHKVARATGVDEDMCYDFAIYVILASILGARLYYVAFSWDLYKDNLLSIFNLRQGGLAIYGGVIGAIITAAIYTRIKKISFPMLLDTGAPGLILGQILGRWGNFFNREAFGEYTDSLFAMQLPVDAVRKQDITELMFQNLKVIDGIEYIQVHPTFLYESVWNICVLTVMLLWIKRKKFQGEIFLIYLFGYGVGRFWIEGLRTDPLLIPGIGIPVSQVLAAAMAVFAVIAFVIGRKRMKAKNNE